MPNFFTDHPDNQWLFENAIDWDNILPLYYPNYPTEDGLENKEEVISFFKELLSTCGDWCGGAVLERARVLDQKGAGSVVDGKTIPGPELQELYREAKELDGLGLPLPREYGGLAAPSTLHMILLGQLARACVGQSTQLAFFTSIAEMIHRFCDEETSAKYIPQIIAAEKSGAMCLTEPGCGSDLALIKTSATAVEDGTYKINGSKFFITNGGGGLHFTLARIKGAPQGLEGISMFLIDQEEPGTNGTNYKVVKNEHKMGMHASFTCEILYENSIARLVGKENEGFKYMLYLMNEARIAVGMQALGGIEGCLGYAKSYAQDRIQFGKPLAELPLMKRNLSDYETERDAIRALLYDTISYYDIYNRLDLKKSHTGDLNENEQTLYKKAMLWTRKRTPLVKYYACEKYTELSTKAIQVLGGYGYMKEYDAERYHRDSFGPLLYEGTSQIQALMALKDMMKYAIKDPAKFLGGLFSLAPTKNSVSSEFASTQRRFKRNMMKLYVKCLRPKSGSFLDPKSWQSDENIDQLMTHAETLCQGMAYIETLRVLCEHVTKDSSRADLYNRYNTLVQPRLEGIYTDWSIR